MRVFTGDEMLAKFDELHALLARAGKLLLQARKEHEQAMEFISRILPNNPTAEDWRAAVNAYKEGRVKPLPPFGDGNRATEGGGSVGKAGPARTD